jgi:pimeloyl-ACP methyl ester carboxylesterase
MTAITRAYAPSRYGQLHYRIVTPAGVLAAPPLLCMHQTPSNGGDWTPVLPALGAGRVVIAVDTPGYGMSDAPPAPARIEDLAGVMAALMDDLAAAGTVPGGPVDVMGFHTGSAIATELARRYPARVRRAVLFGLAAFPAEAREGMLAGLLDYFPAPDETLAHVETLWGVIGDLSDARVCAEDRHLKMAECLRIGHRMPWGYVSVFRYDFLSAIAEVAQPVLVMNPQDDLWDVTTATAHLFRNGRRHDIPGVKHGVLKIEHDRVVAEITARRTLIASRWCRPKCCISSMVRPFRRDQ